VIPEKRQPERERKRRVRRGGPLNVMVHNRIGEELWNLIPAASRHTKKERDEKGLR